MFVDWSLIDSITDSSFAYLANAGCDWPKQLKSFTAVSVFCFASNETVSKQFQNSYETVSFQFHFVAQTTA